MGLQCPAVPGSGGGERKAVHPMGGVVGEIEFEFVQDGAGQGRFMPTGKVVSALLGHLSRGDVKQAAQLYQGCTPEVTSELFREAKLGSMKLKGGLMEMFVSARDFASAARCAEMIDDPGKAAQFFETAYDFVRAADLYRKAGDVPKAALMYEKSLNFTEAARLCLQMGDVARAAENLERGGDVLGAARLYLKAGNWKHAGSILHGVPSNRAEFFEAGTLLAEILWRTGHRDLGVAKLVEVVRAFPQAPQTADLYYRLGEMFHEAGDVEKAAVAFERVAALRPDHKDARAKVEELRRASKLPAAPAGAQDAVVPIDLDLDTGAGTAQESLQLVDPEVEALKELPLLAELEREELRDLAKLAGRVARAAGQSILREGEPARGLFVIRSGQVEVTRGAGPAEKAIATLGPGEYFGEMSLLEDAPVSANVRAKTDAVLSGIPKEDFVRFLYLHERVALKVFRHFAVTLARRLREAHRTAAK